MLINYTPGEECRVAVTRDGKLEEVHAERAGAVSIVGNIYVGRVANVERSIQAAFVDFGMGTNGFLHVSDLHPQYFPGGDDDTTEKVGHKTPRRERPPIERCLKRGQKVLVQVLKENISTKGPTLTSYLSIPGRYLVMLPDMDKVGVSRKVEDDDARRQMRKVLDTLELPKEFGFILRTAGVGKTKTDLKRDLAYLQRLWKDIDRRLKKGDKPRLLYAESDLLMRALRDIWTTDIGEIIIDDHSALQRAYAFMRIVAPRSKTKLLQYSESAPLFHAFGVEEQVELIHAREVPLPSGGSLVIDEAEAMIAIDVNSGKSRSHSDAEQTAYRTNIEAVDEICRQLKLREVGGLLMLDLIDMSKRSHRRDIERQLDERLKLDRASTKALPISQFGIVEMTRQRVRESFRNQHFTRQMVGDVRGWVRKPESVAASALRELAALLSYDKVQSVEMVVAPKVAGAMLSAQRTHLSRLEFRSKKKIIVRVSETISTDRVTMYAYDGSGADVNVEKLPKFRAPKKLEEFDPKSEATAEAWSVDSTLEHEPDLEDLVEEETSKRELDDMLALEAELGDDGEPKGGDSDEDEQGERRGRRRRRRRRRRSGEGEEQRDHAGAASDAGRGDGGEDDSDERSGGPSGEEREDRQREGDEDGEGGGRRKRRRRRRRRRSGEDESREGAGEREGDSAPAASGEDGGGRETGAAAAAEAGEPRNRLAKRLSEKYGETAPSGYPWRGDSWDLEPSAITMASKGDGFKRDRDAALADALKPVIRDPGAALPDVAGVDGGGGRDGRRDEPTSGDRGGDRDSGGGRAGEGRGDDGTGRDGDGRQDRSKKRRRGGKRRGRRGEGAEAGGGGGGERDAPTAASVEHDTSTPVKPAPSDAAGTVGLRAERAVPAAREDAEIKPQPKDRRINTRPKKKVAPKDILSVGVAAAGGSSSASSSAATSSSATSASSSASPRSKVTGRKKAATKQTSSKKTTSKKASSKKASSKKAASKKKKTAGKKTASKKASSSKRSSSKKTASSSGGRGSAG
jgi:ribonuclease E